MDNICKICGEIVTERKHFYSKHKIKESDYYTTHYPRHDLLTKELISFKSPESYFLNDFTSKPNLKKYLESIPKSDGLNYLKNWLLKRKESKNLIYAPGQFELKSLQFPSIKFFHKYYGQNSYENLCLELGLKIRYNYNNLPVLKHNPTEIICDSREQHPYVKLDYPIKIQTLNFGDYCPNPNPENISIERKEISDWAGVMSKGYERFEREIQRAKEANSYVIILIEAKYSDLLSINYLPQTKFIKASSDFLLKRMRDLYLKFDNFQMIAPGNRKDCMNLFNKLVKIENLKIFDIQYLIDCNKDFIK